MAKTENRHGNGVFIRFLSPVTKKRRFRYIFDEPSLAYELPISMFSSWFFYFPVNLLLVRSHQALIIIAKCLIQRCNNVCDEGGSWHY